MDNSEHQKDCICAWCEVERQNAEIRRDRDASARRSAAACSGSSAHDKAWEKNFVVPIARTMKERGIGYMVICLQENGKAAYVLEPTPPDSELVEYLIHPQNA